jgi:hypothetical protein
VLIRDVATLSLDQQDALLPYDQAGPGYAQVVSTTALALFLLVEQGMFLETGLMRLLARIAKEAHPWAGGCFHDAVIAECCGSSAATPCDPTEPNVV